MPASPACRPHTRRPLIRRNDRAPSASRRVTGFGLIDLMLSLLVLGLVFGFALPAWQGHLARAQATATRGALTASLFDAMREATITGRPVVICPDGGGICAGGTDWSAGWIVFVDRDGNRERGIGEPLVGRQPPLSDGVRLFGTVGRQKIVHTRTGRSAGSNATFTLCDRRGPLHAQRLVLANNGRLRTAPAEPMAAAACASALP